MGTTIFLVALGSVVWGYFIGRDAGIKKAKEDAERAAQPKEYDGRGPRDPIHDVMID